MGREEISPRDFQMRLAKLGIEAENFEFSALGRYLHDRADMQIENNTEKLVLADPDDVKANRDLRNQIYLGKMFKSWIQEAINSGLAASRNIEAEDSEV